MENPNAIHRLADIGTTFPQGASVKPPDMMIPATRGGSAVGGGGGDRLHSVLPHGVYCRMWLTNDACHWRRRIYGITHLKQSTRLLFFYYFSLAGLLYWNLFECTPFTSQYVIAWCAMFLEVTEGCYRLRCLGLETRLPRM